MAKPKGVNAELEKFIQEWLKKVSLDTEASELDKARVVDRFLKLEAIKAKMTDENFGQGLFGDDE
jgi:hypothetical protein